MRDYGKVHTSFWTSKTTRDMSEDGRALAMYLLTSPHGTIAGVFRLPDGYICEDLQWDSERVSKGFAELFVNGFANRCESTKWVWISKHFEWNPPENPNQRKAAVKMCSQVPSECVWKPAFMRVAEKHLGIEPEPSDNPSVTLPQPVAVAVAGAVAGVETVDSTIESHAPSPTLAGKICRAIKAEGIGSVSPSNPTLLGLIAAGATPELFTDVARLAKERNILKFSYVLATVAGQLGDAPKHIPRTPRGQPAPVDY